ncbi:MAG: TetR family transcriptional regulator [Acidimicrobiia bacterium]
MTTALARNQAARRRRVLDAAVSLAVSGGFEAVQMRDVATEADVALGTVYRYFSSKERLLLEVNIEQIDGLVTRLDRRPPRGDTPAERVKDVLRRANQALLKQREVTSAMVRALASSPPSEVDAVRKITVTMTGIITSAIGEECPTDDDLARARIIMQVWLSSLVGWVGGVDPGERVHEDLDRAVDDLLDGATVAR